MADIRTKMSVEGISQFKNAMSQGKQAVKTLDAELKLNEARYKASGNAEEYMTNKAKLLKEQIAEQEKVCQATQSALEKMESQGVQKTSQSYQKMAQQLANAKTNLVAMQSSLSGMTSELSGVSSSAKKAGDDIKGISTSMTTVAKNTSFANVSSALGSITSACEGAIGKVVQLGKKLWQAEADATYWADDLITRATKYEMGTTELQQWEYASKLVDTSVESIISARKRLQSKVTQGGNSGVFSFGGELKDLIYQGENMDDIFWDVADTLSKMDDVMLRDQYAQQLFGRSFDELIPLITAGRETWQGFMEEAPTLTEEQVQKLGKANDAYEQLQTQLEVLKGQVASEFAPAFEQISKSLTELLSGISEWIASPEGQAAIEKMTNAITGFIDNITQEDIDNAVTSISNAFSKIMEVGGWIIDHADTIGAALIAAFAALKGSEAFITVMKLVESIKGLSGGGNGTPKAPTIPTTTTKTPTEPTPTAPTVKPTGKNFNPTTPTGKGTPVNPVTTPSEPLNTYEKMFEVGDVIPNTGAAQLLMTEAQQSMDAARGAIVDSYSLIDAIGNGFGSLFSYENVDRVQDWFETFGFGGAGLEALQLGVGGLSAGLTAAIETASVLLPMIGVGVAGLVTTLKSSDRFDETKQYDENKDYEDAALTLYEAENIADEVYTLIDAMYYGGLINNGQYGWTEQAQADAIREQFSKDGDMYQALYDTFGADSPVLKTLDQVLEGNNNEAVPFLHYLLPYMDDYFNTNPVGESITDAVVDGVTSKLDEAAAAGAAITNAVVSQMAAYAGISAGRGPINPNLPQTMNTFTGGNLYAGTINMNGGADAAALAEMLAARQRAAQAGFGG